MNVMGFTISPFNMELGGIVVGLWLLYGLLHTIDRLRDRRKNQ